MKTISAGPAGVREAGKRYSVPDDEAQALIAGGYAEAVEVAAAAAPVAADSDESPEASSPEAETPAPAGTRKKK